MIACAHALKGAGALQEIQLILGGGAAAPLLVVGSGAVRRPEA